MTERERFEEKYRRLILTYDKGSEEYYYTSTQYRWEAWQARAEIAEEEEKEFTEKLANAIEGIKGERKVRHRLMKITDKREGELKQLLGDCFDFLDDIITTFYVPAFETDVRKMMSRIEKALCRGED